MSAQNERLRKQFSQLTTPQKLQFINNLRAQEQWKSKPANMQFLNACIRVYNSEIKNGGGPSSHPPSQHSYSAPPSYQSYPTSNYQPYPSHNEPMYAATQYQGAFITPFRKVFGGILFLIGVIAMSASPVLSFLMGLASPELLAVALIGLIFGSPTIIAYWLMFAAAKSPGNPQSKLFPALTLLKVYMIVVFVILCIGLLISLIAVFAVAAFMGMISDFIGIDITGLGGLVMIIGFLVTAVITAFAIILFRAYMLILSSLRKGISSNIAVPIRGSLPYLVLVSISSGLSLFTLPLLALFDPITTITSLASLVGMLFIAISFFQLNRITTGRTNNY